MTILARHRAAQSGLEWSTVRPKGTSTSSIWIAQMPQGDLVHENRRVSRTHRKTSGKESPGDIAKEGNPRGPPSDANGHRILALRAVRGSSQAPSQAVSARCLRPKARVKDQTTGAFTKVPSLQKSMVQNLGRGAQLPAVEPLRIGTWRRERIITSR